MSVKSIICLAAAEAGRGDIADYLEADDATDAAMNGEVNNLLRCYNLVENEIALDYAPLLATEELYRSSGLFLYTSLTKRVFNVQTVEDEWGNRIPFQLYPTFVKANGEKIVVTYYYLPEKKLLSSESEFMLKISERLLSFGVTREYCLMSGRYDEATVWDKRYKDALICALAVTPQGGLRRKKWA